LKEKAFEKYAADRSTVEVPRFFSSMKSISFRGKNEKRREREKAREEEYEVAWWVIHNLSHADFIEAERRNRQRSLWSPNSSAIAL